MNQKKLYELVTALEAEVDRHTTRAEVWELLDEIFYRIKQEAWFKEQEQLSEDEFDRSLEDTEENATRGI